jgi:cyclic lactone autoinducer peptide
MKKLLVKFDTVLASFALLLSVVAANQACGFFNHQPELPKNVKNLRKF